MRNNILLKKLLSIEAQSKRVLQNLIIITFMLGVNVTAPTRTKEKLKIVNVLLMLISTVGIYAQFCFIWRHRSETVTVYSESICTMLQTIIAIIKMIYYLFMESQFYELLHTAQTGHILHSFEIFNLDINGKSKISTEICDILAASWRDVRRQLKFYICSCLVICSWGILNAIIVNTYNKYTQTEAFDVKLPFDGVFPMWESKGMSFPYYPIQMLIVSCEDYIAGLSAVSFDGLFIVYAVHGAALIRILRMVLRYATHEYVPKAQRLKYLRCCVELHEQIYQYYASLNFLYKYISLSQFFLSLIILCIVMFEVSIGLESDINLFFKSISYMIAAGFEVISYCHNGQRLTTQSELLPQSWYDCAWYNESKEFKYIVRMMIMRTNRALAVHVGGFTTMSLITFLSLFQTSVSYFMLLRKIS